MSKENNAKDIGCLLNCVFLFVQVPMWAVILFGVLSTIDAPTWLWVLYWVYIPLPLVFGLVRAIAENLANQE